MLLPSVRSPRTPTAKYGDVAALSVAATHDPEAGETALFLVNRSPVAQRVEVALHDLPASTLVEHVTLADDGSGSVNDAAHPDRVRARAGTDVRLGPDGLEGRLAASSWHLLRLR